MTLKHKKDWRESQAEVLTTTDGDSLTYLPDRQSFQWDGRHYDFSEVTAFQEELSVQRSYYVIKNRYIFLRIQLGDEALAIQQSQQQDAGYATAMCLRDHLLRYRKAQLDLAYSQGQTLSFLIRDTSLTLEVLPGQDIRLYDTQNQTSQIIQDIQLQGRWLEGKTPEGYFNFSQSSVSDLPLLSQLPEFFEKETPGLIRKNHLYWLKSVFLYAVLLNQIFRFYPPPNDGVMVVLMLLSLWGILHIYGQIIHLIWKPLMDRFNQWTEKN